MHDGSVTRDLGKWGGVARGLSCMRVQLKRAQLHEGSDARGFSCKGVQLLGEFSFTGPPMLGVQLHGVQLQWNRDKLPCMYIFIEYLIYRAG